MNITAVLENTVHKFSMNATLSEAATITMHKTNFSEIIDESVMTSVLEAADGDAKTNILEKIQNIIETVTKFIQTMIGKITEFFAPLENYYKKNIKDFEQKVADFKIPDNLKIQIVNYEKLNILSSNSIKSTMDVLIEKAFARIGLDEKSTVEEIKEISTEKKQMAVIEAVAELLAVSLKGVGLNQDDNTVDKIKAKISSSINVEIQLKTIKDIETAVELIPKYIGIKSKINEILSVTRRSRTSMISRLKSKPEGLRFFYGEYAYFFSSLLSNIYNMISAGCIKSAKACRAVMKLVMESKDSTGKKEDTKDTKNNTTAKSPKPGDDDVIDIE